MKEHLIYSVSLNKEGGVIDKLLNSRVIFNQEGLALKEVEYTESGKEIHTKTFRYSKFGNLIQIVNYDLIDKLVERVEYREDENGIITEEKVIYNDDSFLRKVYEIGRFGNTEKVTQIDSEEKIQGYENYVFDEDGKLIKEIVLNEYGTIESQLEYEYDENRIKEERIYNGEELDVTLRFLYNSEGKEVERREYNNQGKLNQIESNRYDLNGNLIERNTKDFFEEFEVKDIFVFNKKNVMINSKSFSNGTLIFENVCEYDDLNRIKKEHVHEKYIDGSYLSVYCILHEYID